MTFGRLRSQEQAWDQKGALAVWSMVQGKGAAVEFRLLSFAGGILPAT